MRSSSIVLVVLGLAASSLSGVNALGAVHVIHHCPYNVFCAKIRGYTIEDKSARPPADYKRLPYGQRLDGYFSDLAGAPSASILCKRTFSTDSTDVTQLEYEVKDGKAWFDVSNVNGHPFVNEGLIMRVSESLSATYPSCYGAICAPGDANCNQIYNKPNDDQQAMRACSPKVDVELRLCAP